MTLTSTLRRIGLLANPSAGRRGAGSLATEVASLLRRDGHTVLDLSAADLETARSRVSEAIAAGEIDVLAAMGGDGTVHHAANLCAQAPVALALIAMGTGNDNARHLGIPGRDAATVAQFLASAPERKIDLGRVVAEGRERWFIGVLGAGFDTKVNDRGKTLTRLHGTPRYLAAVALELRTFSGLEYAVTVDGERIDTTAMLVAVGNGPDFGGGMKVCPDAKVDDGLLDVLILHRVSRGEFLSVFPRVFTGGHVRHPKVQILRGTRVLLDSPGIRSQADGEDFLPLPITVEAVPGALTILSR
ncbi:MAG TPA: diacylglycerol kinase family protein [Dermatophilaceae bacterium]|nr:diacylglycerol kinase family protein [Dermatophilaceae bacterium]